MAQRTGTNDMDDLVGTDQADVIEALGGNNFLTGKMGDDFVGGGSGGDRIVGGAGKDRLAGNGGADTYVLAKAGDSGPGGGARDVIEDFFGAGTEGDRLDFSGFDAKAGQGGNQAFTLIGATPSPAPGSSASSRKGSRRSCRAAPTATPPRSSRSRSCSWPAAAP